MEPESMDDLSDGVAKLQEFSAVLSTVTRGLDKNVRRLEDQFNKANGALKDMSHQMLESQAITSRLRADNESQLKALKDAVTLAAGLEPPKRKASEYMLDPQAVMDTRTVSVINLQAAEREKEEDVHVTASAHDHKSWLRVVDDSSNNNSRQLGLEVNEALQNLNRTLLKPRVLTMEEQLDQKKMTQAEREAAAAKDFKKAVFPFPELSPDSTLGQAMGAIVQRMFRLEAAVTIQSGVNEALVKIIRDDTQVQAVYDTVIQNIVQVESVQRELASDNAKLRSALGKLGDHVESYEKSMAELARGGRLRIEKRDKRLERAHEDDVVEKVEWGLDAFTVEESDFLAKRITILESQLSSNGSVGVALRRINNELEDLQTSMVERQEAEKAIKKLFEESADSSGILKKKVLLAKEKWAGLVEDIKFGISSYEAKQLAKQKAEEEGEGEGEGEDGSLEGGDEEEEEDEGPPEPIKLPLMLEMLQKLSKDAESALLDAFYIHENMEDTLDVLFPRLDQLTLHLEEVFALDSEIRFGGGKPAVKAPKTGKVDDEDEEEELPVVTIADVLTIRRDYSLKTALQNAGNASLPVIDERVDKIGMRRRIEKIEKASVSNDVLDAIERSSKEMRKELKTKANKDDVALALSKRVLKSDVLRLKELVMNHIELTADEHEVIDAIAEEVMDMSDSIVAESSVASSYANRSPNKGAYGGGGSQSPQPGRAGTAGGGSSSFGGGGGGASSKEVQEVSTRIELLLKHMQELQANCTTFIPREEVQEAMKAVLYEIKVIKMNTVNVNKFKEVTDLKADKDEMHSLMTVLTETLSDMMGTNVTSAAKRRCLLCDKPTVSVSRRGERERDDRSPSPPRGGVRAGTSVNQQSSIVESVETGGTRPSTSAPRLASSSSTSRLPDHTRETLPHHNRKIGSISEAQITTEITILKNTVDLPAIDQPNSARNNYPDKQRVDVYKSRVRSSGGGGSVVGN